MKASWDKFFKGQPQSLFNLFLVFSKNRAVASCRIWNWIFGVEGKDADHYTTTAVQQLKYNLKHQVFCRQNEEL